MSLEQRNREFALRTAQLFNQAAAKRGDLAALQTAAKNSTVAAINELLVLVQTANAYQGDLSTLITADKASLVAALNEIKATVDAATNIDDSAATTNTTYSSSKIVSLVQGAVAEITDNAPEALNTLRELASELTDQEDLVQALLAGQSQRVSFAEAQTLTAEQALQARQNIQAVGATDIGDYDLDLVGVLNSALTDLANQ